MILRRWRSPAGVHRGLIVLMGCMLLCQEAMAATIQYLSGASGYMVSALDNKFYIDVQYRPNSTSAKAQLSRDGITLAGSSNLPNGELRMGSVGSVPVGYGRVDAAAAAYMLDTITANGSIGGSNLNLNLAVSGTTSSSDKTTNANFLLVGFYPVGHLQAASQGDRDFYDPAYRIWGAAYALGENANPSPNLDGYGYVVSASYGDGAFVIPLQVPFQLLGSSFEMHLLLGSQQMGDSGSLHTWNNNYGHTVGVALSADPGIQLWSNAGIPGTQSSVVPEPATFWTLGLSAAFLGLLRRFRG